MNFQNMNPFNDRVNVFSSNLLPMTSGDSGFSVASKVYNIIIWLILTIQSISVIFGFFVFSMEKILVDGTVLIVVTIEVYFMFTRIYTQRKLLQELIRKLNDILIVGDDTMRSIVETTLKPMEIPLKIYFVGGTVADFVWCCLPFKLIFEKTSFFYTDYRAPAILYKQQPFSMNVFLFGSVLLTIGCVYIFVKKVGIDIYMIHLVLLITAQYRYIATRLVSIFREGNLRSERAKSRQGYYTTIDRSMAEEMQALCRHHNAVIRLSSMLKELLSLNFSMLYVNSVLRFCAIAVMIIITATSRQVVEFFCIISYACGSIMQFYMLCFCVQQLLDASTEVTDKAFHEKWHQFGPSVKRTFLLMILGNNLECKLSACDKFNLSVSSFMTIMNQSYSIALLLLRMK